MKIILESSINPGALISVPNARLSYQYWFLYLMVDQQLNNYHITPLNLFNKLILYILICQGVKFLMSYSIKAV